jgi:hypothetical protein
MTDSTLQSVWDSRDSISKRCGYAPKELVRFYQKRQNAGCQQPPKRKPTGRKPAATR